MADHVVHLPTPEIVVFEQVEEQIEAARTELGNAGFAALVGLVDLSIESLDTVIEHVQAARAGLEQVR